MKELHHGISFMASAEMAKEFEERGIEAKGADHHYDMAKLSKE